MKSPGHEVVKTQRHEVAKSRRHFLKTLGASTLSLPLFAHCANSAGDAAANIRNVLFIISDDHSASVMGCYGNDIIRTPNLDRLAGRGMRFDRAYANAPMCSASRQSLITGKYPHASGVTLLRTSFPEEQVTLAEHLKQYNYRTALIGKSHFNNNLSHGFDLLVTRADHNAYVAELPSSEIPSDVDVRPPWRPFRDHSRTWLNADMLPGPNYDRHSMGTYFVDRAMTFLGQETLDPFFLVLSFHEPHSPFNFPVEYAGKYKPEDMPLPTGGPEDDRWIPAVFKDLTEEERRGIIASYYTSVEYMDKNVGLILGYLEQTGLMDETMVVYLGDHGYLLNDHKRFEKHMMWEPAVRAPLLVAAGGSYAVNASTDAMTEFVDIVPTVLDMLALPAMAENQGRSFKPLLAGESDEHKDYVFAEFLADNKAMVRTKDWKYVFTSGKRDLGQGYATGNPPPGIVHRLYYLPEDPDETQNVAGLQSFADTLAELQALMLDHFKRTHPKSAELPDNLSMDEALSWFCEPPDAGAELDAQ